MRNLKKSLLFLAALALFNSCADEYVTEENLTIEQYTGSQVRVYDYDVVPNDWKVEHSADGRNYLYAEFDNQDITQNVVDNGVVIGSVLYTYNLEENLKSWNNMPYVFPFFTKDTAIVAENIRFEYEVGKVTFVIEDADAVTPEDMVEPISFKVSVITNMDVKKRQN